MENDKAKWEVPELTEFGKVEELTLKDKKLGGSDDFAIGGISDM